MFWLGYSSVDVAVVKSFYVVVYIPFLVVVSVLECTYAGCRSMCLFTSSFLENQASLNSLHFFLGSVVIVVLSK